MPSIKIIRPDLEALVGIPMTREEIIGTVEALAGEVEGFSGDEITIKFEPVRPDLFSVEGIARALRGYLEIETGLKRYQINQGSHQLIVEKSVSDIRPVIVGGFVRGLRFDDYLVRSFMDFQEKIHSTLGRNRKKVSIGVHDASRVSPPFRYKGVDPESVRFVPLGMEKGLTLSEILQRHEKGIEFRWILDGMKRYPLLVDKNENVLSFPPIINGELTRVCESTTDIFIDVTGLDSYACSKVLTILCCAFADRGGKLESIQVCNGNDVVYTPVMHPARMRVSLQDVRRTLDPELRPDTCIRALKKLGHDARYNEGESMLEVEIPAYRCDILHAVDLIEDIAIGMGYDSFPPLLPGAGVMGMKSPQSSMINAVASSLTGLGFTEITTLTLTSEDASRLNARVQGEHISILNPLITEYTHLRRSLMPGLFQILSLNRRREMPIRIFEIGRCAIPGQDKPQERIHLCGAVMHPKAGFTECKSTVESVFRDLGVRISIEAHDDPVFIPGRSAEILLNHSAAGVFGEVHPEVLVRFDLPAPVIAFEIDLDEIMKGIH